MWRRWTFSVGVRRAERMLCKWGVERVGDATRQWWTNWCSEFEEAAMKAMTAERAAEAVKIKAAAMAKAMGAVKAKVTERDRMHKSQ